VQVNLLRSALVKCGEPLRGGEQQARTQSVNRTPPPQPSRSARTQAGSAEFPPPVLMAKLCSCRGGRCAEVGCVTLSQF
jgi:hypothetical protein